MAPATASGPTGSAMPVMVRTPPAISVAAAASAISLPGYRPLSSKTPLITSRPGPWNLPSSFWLAWMPM